MSCHVASGVTPTAARLRPSSAWACGGSSRLGRFGSYSIAQGWPRPLSQQPPLPREGTPSVSPALFNSLSLDLDREQLSGATLEHRGVASVFQKSLHPSRLVP